MTKTSDDLIARARRAEPAEAVALYRRALAQDPAQPRVLKDLAAAAARTGQRDLAIGVAEDCFQRCEGRPDLQFRIAFVLHMLGTATTAVKAVVGLATRGIDPEGCAKALNYVMPGADPGAPETAEALAILLRHGWGSATHAATFSAIARSRLTDVADDAAFAALPLFADPLFIEGLRFFIVTDRMLELALTRLRGLLARGIGAGGALDPALAHLRPALMALAEQCFANEYVWNESREDMAARERLTTILDAARSAGGDLNDAAAALGCFAPLHELPWAAALPVAPQDHAWAAVLRRQVDEPARERALAAEIPALDAITDRVSLAVRDQYQENPYPRWVIASHAEPMARPRPPGMPAEPPGAPMDVLVAGCGTGHHAIQVAGAHPGARILAVDLSRASLAYAMRKTAELGIKRISYFQADILNLGRLAVRFDQIECGGVLHHLRDPAAGLKVLTGLLKPDGMMRLALYSRRARHKILAAQALRAREGHPATPAGIRRFREQLFALPQEHPAAATQYPDVFSTSACRDLLFHVQEANFDIPELEALLAGCGLVFGGFDNVTRDTQFDYLAAHPDDAAMISLATWDALERAKPDTFINMYQFWVYKSP